MMISCNIIFYIIDALSIFWIYLLISSLYKYYLFYSSKCCAYTVKGSARGQCMQMAVQYNVTAIPINTHTHTHKVICIYTILRFLIGGFQMTIYKQLVLTYRFQPKLTFSAVHKASALCRRNKFQLKLSFFRVLFSTEKQIPPF